MKIYKVLIISLFHTTILQAQENHFPRVEQYVNQGKYEEADKILKDNNDPVTPFYLSLLGEVSMRLGRIEEAEEILREALKLLESSDEKDAELYATTLNRMALLYWNKGQDVESRKYMLRAIDIRSQQTEKSGESIAASYNDLGLITTRIDPQYALENYQKALSLYRELYGPKSEKVAQSLINTGILYKNINRDNDALKHLNEARIILSDLYPDGHPTIAFIHTNTGRIYEQRGSLTTASEEYQKALAMYIKIYKGRHPEIANASNLLGQIKIQQGDYLQASSDFQFALIMNSPTFDGPGPGTYPTLDNYYQPYTLLNSILYQSINFQQRHYNKSLYPNDLKQAMRALELCDSLIAQLRYSAVNEQDKIAFGEIASGIYDQAVNLSISMSQRAFIKAPYFDKAFYFNERSKAAALQEAINSSHAKNFAGIPEDVLRREEEMIRRINYLRQNLVEKPRNEKELREELYTLENKHNALIREMETIYPQYFALKYDQEPIGLRQAQNKLNEKSAIISYYISGSDNRLHIFVLTKKKFNIYSRSLDSTFNRYLTGYRNSIYYREKTTYTFSSEKLSDVLIPKIPAGIEHLIIIPTERLNSIPFESLFTRRPGGGDYTTLPYLINKYSISYAFSASLYFLKLSEKQESPPVNNLIMAPVDFVYDDMKLPSLPATEMECSKISDKLKQENHQVEVYIGPEASKKQLEKLKLRKHNIVHLATHGFIDENQPDLSRIYLGRHNDNGELYAGELYNLNLNAEIITLSACETGLGKISKGEGVLGFTRALLYAGANNITVSLWNVQDNSTATFMVDFYEHSLKNNNFSKGLQQAKLQMIKGSDYNEPYYWAPFVLIGN